MKTVRKGSKGNDVVTLQIYLHLMQDGIFGKLTQEAVKQFQREHYLEVDGIVGPKTWAALEKQFGVQPKKSKRKITMLIVHCSATCEGKDYTVADIRRWHTLPEPKGRGWSDIGYHYVIYRDGTVHAGRDVNISGAHTADHNTNSIGICYVGGLGSDRKAKDTRTPEQKQALIKLLKELMNTYNLKPSNVYGHYQFANKACPSFKIEPLRKELL